MAELKLAVRRLRLQRNRFAGVEVASKRAQAVRAATVVRLANRDLGQQALIGTHVQRDSIRLRTLRVVSDEESDVLEVYSGARRNNSRDLANRDVRPCTRVRVQPFGRVGAQGCGIKT